MAAPDFSKFPNVEKEQVVAQRPLFRIVEDGFEVSARAEATKHDIDDELSPWLNLYDRVGGYYGWGWKQFYYETPYWVIKGLLKKISAKINKLEDGKSFLRWQSVDVAIGIARALGGKSEDDED
jgi:hypothetical protein